jgi:hypothetical protein
MDLAYNPPKLISPPNEAIYSVQYLSLRITVEEDKCDGNQERGTFQE